jgi:SanA protein
MTENPPSSQHPAPQGPNEAASAPLIKRWARRLFFLGLGAVLLVIGTILGADLWIRQSAGKFVFTTPEKTPRRDVGLVLGTSKYVRGGWINMHFAGRMKAAAALYHAGKVKHLLVSGSNPSHYYDEATDMREALIHLGVPPEDITRDFAGFRTFDSIVRAEKVFELEQFTIITDHFHTYRSVYIARHFGLDVVAFAADDISLDLSMRSKMRERLANLKALLDLHILGTEPKFLGEPVPVDLQREGGGEETPPPLDPQAKLTHPPSLRGDG